MQALTDRAPDQPCVPTPAPPLEDTQVLYVRGLSALRDGDAESAVCLLLQARRRQPLHQGMRRNLVRALLLAERYDELVIEAEAALDVAPNDAELHFAHATALNALGQHAAAYAAFSRALSLQPNHAASWLNMGNVSVDLGQAAAAETSYRTAIHLDPALAEAHASLGYILTMQGRLPEAVEACEAAIHHRPDFAQAHWNLAIAALLSGDLKRGFTEYEWRKRHGRYQVDFPILPGRRWNGTDPSGQTILVRAEQGLGDVVQFARYLPLIQAMGGEVILQCAPSLVPLINAMPGIKAVASSDAVTRYDAWIDQASLPLAFNTTLWTIPTPGAYLQADPDRVRTWRSRLQAGCKVGIVFTGNPKHQADRRRSVPLDLITMLTEMPDVSFVNLHHGASASSLGLADLTAWMTDYAETAALIDTLDLVIAVDTSVAHLAGALGKPVWILLPHAPDWRWLLDRTDSPWYRSARLFRQPVAGDWISVLIQVRCALALFQTQP